MTDPRILRLSAKLYSLVGLGLAILALTCAALALGSERERRRQEHYRRQDDAPAERTVTHAR